MALCVSENWDDRALICDSRVLLLAIRDKLRLVSKVRYELICENELPLKILHEEISF